VFLCFLFFFGGTTGDRFAPSRRTVYKRDSVVVGGDDIDVVAGIGNVGVVGDDKGGRGGGG
jgi:hypothetical protein